MDDADPRALRVHARPASRSERLARIPFGGSISRPEKSSGGKIPSGRRRRFVTNVVRLRSIAERLDAVHGPRVSRPRRPTCARPAVYRSRTPDSCDPLLIISTTVQSGTKSFLPLARPARSCALARDARVRPRVLYTRTRGMTYEP